MMEPEIAVYEALAKDILRRCMAEEAPEEIHRWLTEQVARLGGGDENAVMPWMESIRFTENMLTEYERIANLPEHERKILRWPWQSWNKLIDPLEEGMLGLITAPDGQGKTIVAESIAEHWAQRKIKVVFVHYELNRKLMMLRRTARWTGIPVRTMKEGKMNRHEQNKVAEMSIMLTGFDGSISYLHTPGWTTERTITEVQRLRANGECDVVLVDYLEKASASQRQLKMFGSNLFQREADNVEQWKNFSESTAIPTLMVAQMSKQAKSEKIDKMDRTGIRGAGEKSDKSNLVVMLKRERTPDGYSPIVDVLIDKNTMGATGSFQQVMQPEFFRIGDMYQELPA